MRIRSLYLPSYKNLIEFELPYGVRSSEGARLEGDESILMVLGRNGTGKSNLLEALLTIFGELDLGRESSFPYQITYECARHLVTIDCTGEVELIEVVPEAGGQARSFTRKQFAAR